MDGSEPSLIFLSSSPSSVAPFNCFPSMGLIELGVNRCVTWVSVQHPVTTNRFFFDFIDRRRINGDPERERLTYGVASFLVSKAGECVKKKAGMLHAPIFIYLWCFHAIGFC